MKKILVVFGLLSSLLIFSSQSMADSYTYYDSIVNSELGKAKERNKVILSYKYESGLLIILTKDGKKLSLKDGVYVMNNGDKFYTQSGAVVKHEKGSKKSSTKSKVKKMF